MVRPLRSSRTRSSPNQFSKDVYKRQALRDTTWYGSGTDDCAQVFDRQLRDEQDVSAS